MSHFSYDFSKCKLWLINKDWKALSSIKTLRLWIHINKHSWCRNSIRNDDGSKKQIILALLKDLSKGFHHRVLHPKEYNFVICYMEPTKFLWYFTKWADKYILMRNNRNFSFSPQKDTRDLTFLTFKEIINFITANQNRDRFCT